MIPETKVFHLYLSTLITAPVSNLVVPLTTISTTTTPNVSWQVDWDSLFRGWNKKYRRCNVKLYLQTQSFSASANDWETFSGVLVCNLPSDAGSSTNWGTALSLYNPADCPTTGTTTHSIVINTLSNQQGVDVLIPQANSIFTLTFLKPNATLDITAQAIPSYQVLLQFELSEPIDDTVTSTF
jgi:hypothetical protein